MTLRIAIIITLQTLALVAMVAMKQWTLSTGTPILLETRPIDPRSLFRGDYVRLNYTIGRLKLKELAGDDDFNKHDPLHVALEKEEKYWRPISVHLKRPDISAQQVAIKGKVKYVRNSFWNRETRKSEKTKVANVRYGIENYFVPEGEGMALERPRRGEKVDIQVAVDNRGNAGIKGVLVNDKLRYIEKLL